VREHVAEPWEREPFVRAGGWGPEKAKQFSGYVNVKPSSDNRTYSHLFYWAFEARNSPATAPWLVWLTGGPGCSSQLALFTENGPYKVDKAGNVTLNPYSWNTNANVIFIDQPVGTGFSYADSLDDYATNETEVAYQMLEFLKQFQAAQPAFTKNDFFLFGESYAGHYVPAVAHAIVKANAAGTARIPLKGIGIGNGWVDPRAQYAGYYEFAYKNKFINEFERAAFEGANAACLKLIDSGGWFAALELCSVTMQAVLEAIAVHVGYQPNVYDVTIPCKKPPLCYDFSNVDAVLNDASVKAALGVPAKRRFTECSMFVHTLMLGDWVGNFAVDLPAVLAAGIRVEVYSGVNDFICNYVGGLDWTTAMEWPGKAAFNAAPLKPWAVNGKLAGSVRSATAPGGKGGAFEFVEVLGAGHLAPMNRPVQTLALLDAVLQGKPLDNK